MRSRSHDLTVGNVGVCRVTLPAASSACHPHRQTRHAPPEYHLPRHRQSAHVRREFRRVPHCQGRQDRPATDIGPANVSSMPRLIYSKLRRSSETFMSSSALLIAAPPARHIPRPGSAAQRQYPHQTLECLPVPRPVFPQSPLAGQNPQQQADVR